MITETQREMLAEAQRWCDAEDKSTEFMIQYMQDYASVDFDDVIEYLQEQAL